MWIVAPTDKDAYLITGQTLDRPTLAVTHDAGAPLLRQHLDRHLAVGLGTAQVNQDRHTGFGPGLIYRREDRLNIGA